MKKYILCFILIALRTSGFTQKSSREWLRILNNTLEESGKYDDGKLRKIDSIYQNYRGHDQNDLYAYYLQLFEEYSLFIYDSAYAYANKLHELAFDLKDSEKIDHSNIKLNFILLSSGMFKEVIDSLNGMNLKHLSNSQKSEYYLLMARCYFDLSDYNHDDFFSPRYSVKAQNYLDSSLQLFPTDSFEFNYYTGLKYIRSGKDLEAANYFQKLMNVPGLSPHEIALTYSTYADIYVRKEQTNDVIILLAKAAIADIQSSTKETSATYNLSTLLFKQGDIEDASLFIAKAAADAQFYGARQRMVQISSILPIIAGKRITAVESEERNIFQYSIIITSLFLLLIILGFIIIKQVRKQRIQQKEINRKNSDLQILVKEKDVLLEEKEWLRKEIHHRVKNNLHTVMSLLESQSAFLENDALLAIRDSQHRIYSMSLIHQKLYQSEDVTSLYMPDYIAELVSYLRESFGAKQQIRIEMQIEPIELNVAHAVPVGIILTESITNAIKYAFPGNIGGVITISLVKSGDNHILLSIIDNGVGMPTEILNDGSDSLGMRLMKGLSEDINGILRIESSGGTEISVEFSTDLL
jgi:two-component sensor histidine kinase